MSHFTDLERAVMEAISSADREPTTMRRQIDGATLISRELTGVGFYTTFEVPESLPRLNENRWKIEDMGHGFAYHPELEGGASFILWVKGGRVVCLEGYTNGGDWPRDEHKFHVAV